MPSALAEHVETAHSHLPASADGGLITSGASWAWGAYVQLAASASADDLFTGWYGYPGIFFSEFEYEYSVAVGAGGAEVDKSVFRGGNMWTSRGTTAAHLQAIAGAYIASGDRVAIRARTSLGSTQLWRMAVGIYPAAFTGLMDATTAPLRAAPSGAAGAAITPSGTTFVSSAWAEVEDATDDDWLLHHVTLVGHVDANWASHYEIDVGVGAAGNEALIDMYRGAKDQSQGDGFVWANVGQPIRSADAIPSGSRVAVRLRKSGTHTQTHRIAIGYFKASEL